MSKTSSNTTQFHKTIFNRRSLLVSALLCTAAIAGAQATTTHTPPTPAQLAQRRVNGLTKEYGLSTSQQASALLTFTNAFTQSQGIQASLHTTRQSIETAVKANDGNTINNLAMTEGTLSGQLAAINYTADAAFYLTLNATQQAIFGSHHGGGGRGGPGGFRGPR